MLVNLRVKQKKEITKNNNCPSTMYEKYKGLMFKFIIFAKRNKKR